MKFDLRVESRFKNALLFRALDEALGPGWTNRKAANYCGVEERKFGQILRLKRNPKVFYDRRYHRGVRWSVVAERIATALCYSCEELFPDSLYSLGLPDCVVREFSSPEILSLQEAGAAGLLPSATPEYMVQDDAKRLIESALSDLTGRERFVLKNRFGLGGDEGDEHTLDEVACALGVGRERVRQIEAKALRKLRHESRSARLRPLLDECEH